MAGMDRVTRRVREGGSDGLDRETDDCEAVRKESPERIGAEDLTEQTMEEMWDWRF